ENGLRLLKGDPAAQIDADSLEMTREYARLLALKESLEARGLDLSAEDQTLFEEVSKEVLPMRRTSLNAYNTYKSLKEKFLKASSELTKAGVAINLTSIRAFNPT